jgi:hypothetical protein
MLEGFGDRVWPTSSFGYGNEDRPAVILGEYCQLLPYDPHPTNVWQPFCRFMEDVGIC